MFETLTHLRATLRERDALKEANYFVAFYSVMLA